MPFDSETRNDEIAVDVPLPEEPAEVSGENDHGWITEEAFFTVLAWCATSATVQGSKDESHCHLQKRREFLKSTEVEWQTLLKNQADKVLSLKETAQARARWTDRAMDISFGPRTWKPDDSKSSGRRAKARLIIQGFHGP